ncbi:NAD-dependent glyceraldehyde-3-phosphate dehydrogenase [Klebsiella pneumoniae subsp. rhinoscleromatis]|nr:NAD-dependent glyceraldehyde-3-phosphate dehydrogenase [Klebsiella pneumoniae subsp. rhinoscleromatis]
MSKLGINGFGRIGRLVLRRLLEVDSSLEVVAINDLTSPKVLAYLLKHDSNYGPFPWSVDFTEDALIVNGKTITVYAEKEAQHIPWQAAGAEVIVEWYRVLHLGREIANPSPGRRAQSADFRPRRRDENHRLQRQR